MKIFMKKHLSHKKNNGLLPIILTSLIILLELFSYSVVCQSFCHISCKFEQCGSSKQSACRQCQQGFIKENQIGQSRCSFDTNQTQISLESTEYSIQPPSNVSTCGDYQFYGQFQNQSIINITVDITSNQSIQDAHYQVQLVLWIILIGGWSPTTDFIQIFQISNDSNIRTIVPSEGSQPVQQCTKQKETYIKMSWSIPHFSFQTPLVFVMQSQVFSSLKRKWGLGDMLLFSKSCSQNCSSCTGPNQNQCTTCIQGMLLYVDGTCVGSCPQGFGLASVAQASCIKCQQMCSECHTMPENCSSCFSQTLQKEIIYHIAQTNQCRLACPTGYYRLVIQNSTECVQDSDYVGQQYFALYYQIQEFSNKIGIITSQIGVQQVVKSGSLSLIFPGAQLSSLLLTSKSQPNPSFYEHMRFWGSFIHFEVPPYGKGSTKQKYLLYVPDSQILQGKSFPRLLQSQNTLYLNEFSFDRLGYKGYFIIDCYLQISLICFSWLLVLIGWILSKKTSLMKLSTSNTFQSRIYAIFHKIHEISMFYLIIASLIEYRNNSQQILHSGSIATSCIFLCYFLIYQLKIFYDMQYFPCVRLGTKQYDIFTKKYSIFTAYYRFQQYKDSQKLLFAKVILRPYNFHSLIFVKKALMLLCIMIFYDFQIYQNSILVILQIVDIARYALTMPYESLNRNITYLSLQFFLLVFFICGLIDYLQQSEKLSSNHVNIWIGIICLYLYNILFSLTMFVQFIILCKYSLPQMTAQIRKRYYESLLDHFDQYGSYYRLIRGYTDELQYCQKIRKGKTYKDWLNGLHGVEPVVDLSQNKFKVIREIFIRGRIGQKQQNVDGFSWCEKDLSKNKQKNNQITQIKIQKFKITEIQYPQRQYITPTPKKLNPRFTTTDQYTKSQQSQQLRNLQKSINVNFTMEFQLVTQILKGSESKNQQSLFFSKNYRASHIVKEKVSQFQLNHFFQSHIVNSIFSFTLPDTNQITLNTWISVDLSHYKENQAIKMRPQNMKQTIQIVKADKTKVRMQLEQILNGFPVNWKLFEEMSKKDIKGLRNPKNLTIQV